MAIKITDLSNIKNTPITRNDNKSGTVFNDIYKAAINLVEETNQTQKVADKMSVDFAAGKIDSIHEVMIASEKANIALQYTVQLRNKVLEAYNEIMRMQV